MELKKVLSDLFLNNKNVPVVIFCDPGVDDALMLWQILTAERYQVLGVVAGAGNTNRAQTINNAQRILAGTGRTDVKVYAGCEAPIDVAVDAMLSGVEVYGNDGLNGFKLPIGNNGYLVTDGIDFACEKIRQQPVCIISTGGLTDLYRVLSRLQHEEPEKFKNILAISMMAGVINATQEANAPIATLKQSEFNILFDIKASRGMFALAKQHHIPILLSPLDLTHSLLCSQQDAKDLQQLKNPVADYFYQLLNNVPGHYITHYGQGPDGTYRQPIHDLHASNSLMHPEQYYGNWTTITIDEQGKLNVKQEEHGNVFLMQFSYLKREEFFKTLLSDLRQYNDLTLKGNNTLYPEIMVFDLDDTLWDCLQHYRHHINNTREQFGLIRWSHDEFNQFGYVHREHMFQHMFGDNTQAALEHFYQLFDQHLPQQQHARLLNDVQGLLATLRNKGIKLIAWSNTEDVLVQCLMDHFELRSCFDHVMGSGGCASLWQDLKPNPKLFETALQKLNLAHVDRQKIWFVGDSLSSDIKCGHNANCITVWYNPNRKHNSTDIKPHIIITSLAELELVASNNLVALLQPEKQNTSLLIQQFGLFPTSRDNSLKTTTTKEEGQVIKFKI